MAGPGDFHFLTAAQHRPENQIPQSGGRPRAPQPRGNTRYSPNCFKETCFKERCQALSPLPPLPVRPGQHLDHLGCSSSLPQTTGPRPRAVRGQQQGLNTPPSGRQRCYSSRQRCYSSLPSKQREGMWGAHEGFRVPPIPATPGRTQPTPRVSRSVGAEVIGEFMSMLGIYCSILLVVIYYVVEKV